MSAVLAGLRDDWALPASAGLLFIDAATGQPVQDGLQCELLLRRNQHSLGRALCSPSGVHHWPELHARWRDALPPPLVDAEVGVQVDIQVDVLADVVVTDTRGRFLPLAIDWPLPASLGGEQVGTQRLVRVPLLSAPARDAPPGYASVYALLVWHATQQPAAWARVLLADAAGRISLGGCDAAGRLALHLALPRPQRPAVNPPPPGVVSATVSLQVFFDLDLGPVAERLAAPDMLAFSNQAEVRALARADQTTALDALRLEVGHPAVPTTAGMAPALSELRLVPR